MPSRTDWLLPPATRDDFEVAIVCALDLEAAAVLAACDCLYLEDYGQEYGKADGDPNQYTTGRMGNHSVVVVTLEHMGKEAAAKASATLRMSFRSISLALLVGICGGVPRTPQGEEILLGDVVISSELYQYDFQRIYPGGPKVRDTRKHMKNDPSVALIVNRLQNSHKQRFQVTMEKELGALGNKQGYSRYTHPGVENDVLFQSEYVHKHSHQEALPVEKRCTICGPNHDKTCEEAQQTPCIDLGCDPRFHVRRERLEATKKVLLSSTGNGNGRLPPVVHFGIMGSGDSVIKSAVHRDAIAAATGIVAVEMESAGMFGVFAGLVIKSVCDYADSHKNKAWQDYAAATAACAAKALLQTYTPRDRNTMTPYKEDYRRVEVQLMKPPQPKHRAWGNFVDRPEIMKKMESYYFAFPAGKHQKRFIICGMAGTGKTQLALRFADFHRQRFWAIFEVDASSQASAQSDFANIAQWAGRKPTWDNGVDYLATCSHDWLLILDHADDKTLALDTLLPSSDQGCILITTRSKDYVYQGVDLDENPMSVDQAITLLLQDSLKDPDNPESRLQAQPIVEELGCLPLAIKHCALPIRRRVCSVEGIFGYYQRNKGRMLGDGQGNSRSLQSGIARSQDAYAYPSIYASIDLSLQTMIAPPKLNGLDRALEILQLCAFFHFQDIPVRIFNAAPSWRDQGTFQKVRYLLSKTFLFKWHRREASATTFSEEQPTYTNVHIRNALSCITSLPWRDLDSENASRLDENSEALALLHRSGLGVLDIDAGLFSLHPVVQEWNRHRLAEEDVAWARWSAGVGLSHIIPWQEGANGDGAGQVRRKLFSHVDNYIRMGIAEGARQGVRLTMNQAQVGEKFSLVYQDSGYYQVATTLFEEAWWARRDTLGKEHPDALKSLGRLAAVQAMQRHYRVAESFSKEAWEGMKDLGVSLEDDALASLNTYATSLHGLGRFREAEEVQRDCLRARKRAMDEEDAVVVESTNNLGITLLRLGKSQEAIQLLKQAYNWRKKRFGDENELTIQSLQSLSAALRDSGETAEAEVKCRQALGLRKQLLGNNHPDTLVSLVELAIIIRKLGEVEEAERLSQEASNGMSKRMGLTNPDTLESLSALAAAFHDRGENEKAKKLYTTILAGYQEQFEPNHPDVLRIRSNLASELMSLEQYENAEQMYRETLAAFKRHHEPQHPDVIKCKIGFAVLLSRMGGPDRTIQAAEIHREVEEHITEAYPSDSLLRLDWLYNYSIFLRRRGNYGKATMLVADAQRGYEAKLGPNSPAVLDCIASIAYMLDLDGRYAEAWGYYENALERYEKAGLGASPNYVGTVGRFADMRGKMESLGMPVPDGAVALAISPSKGHHDHDSQSVLGQQKRRRAQDGELSEGRPACPAPAVEQTNTKRRRTRF
ncbi:hypothetical protein BX600DRAFT_513736 [Xylariales sp. PMI_506]|nr:hypothetical protein BX600DRAFT_513736 [Xylariales sp. PMI_506]